MKRNALTLSTLTLLVAVTILSACGKEEKAPSVSDAMKHLPNVGSLPTSGGNPGGGFNSDPNFNVPSNPDFKMPSGPDFKMPSRPGFNLPSGPSGFPSTGGFPSVGGASVGVPSLHTVGRVLERVEIADRSVLQSGDEIPGFKADLQAKGPGGKWSLEEKKSSHTEKSTITFEDKSVTLTTVCTFNGNETLKIALTSGVQYADGVFAIAKNARRDLMQNGRTCRARLDKGIYAYEVNGQRMSILAKGEKNAVELSKE